jgi:hypothetical protein
VAGHSLNGELYYRFRPVSWLELQPGMQYWHRPGGVAQTQDAWVVVENRRDLLIVAILITFFTCQVERRMKLLQCQNWIVTAAAGKT